MATTKELLKKSIPLAVLGLVIGAGAWWLVSRNQNGSENLSPATPASSPLPTQLQPRATETLMPIATATAASTALVLYLGEDAYVIPPNVTPDYSMPNSCRAWYPTNKILPKGWRGDSTDNCMGLNIHLVENAGGGVTNLIAQGPTESP